MTPDRLLARLRGRPEGMTRSEIASTFDLGDRAARDLIAELRASAIAPVLCDRGPSNREEGRYRIAQAHETEAVNREINERVSRGKSEFEAARGIRTAFQNVHQSGSLFLTGVPSEDTA